MILAPLGLVFGCAAAQASTSTAVDQRAIEEALARDAALEPSAPPAAGAVSIQSLLPDISLIADFALAAFSERENLQLGGHDPTTNGFNLQQIEVSISGAVDPYFRFDSFIVFGLLGVEVEEAVVTTLDLPWGLQARAGQFLTRFGRINPTHPHSWDFVDQALPLGRIFGGENNRGLGLELSWLTPLPWYVELVFSGTMAGGEGTARSFYGANDLGVESPIDLQYVTAIKQFFPFSDDWGLLFGLSAALGPNSTGRDNRTDVFGTDIFLKYRPVGGDDPTIISLQSEWFFRQRQVPEALLRDLSGYVQLSHRFDRRWGVAARWELGTPASGGADLLDPDWTEDRHRLAASLTFWPTEFSRLRAEASADIPGWLESPIYAAFLALEVGIGAHAAHSF